MPARSSPASPAPSTFLRSAPGHRWPHARLRGAPLVPVKEHASAVEMQRRTTGIGCSCPGENAEESAAPLQLEKEHASAVVTNGPGENARRVQRRSKNWRFLLHPSTVVRRQLQPIQSIQSHPSPVIREVVHRLSKNWRKPPRRRQMQRILTGATKLHRSRSDCPKKRILTGPTKLQRPKSDCPNQSMTPVQEKLHCLSHHNGSG